MKAFLECFSIGLKDMGFWSFFSGPGRVFVAAAPLAAVFITIGVQIGEGWIGALLFAIGVVFLILSILTGIIWCIEKGDDNGCLYL